MGNLKKSLTVVVLAVLIAGLFCFFEINPVAAYTGTITYSAATDVITAKGGNTSIPITFNDLYLADVAGGWGQVFKQGNNQFLFNAKIALGDVSGTYTYFADSSKQIVLNATGTTNPIRIYGNATFVSGVLVNATNKISKDGCSFIKTATDTATMLFRPMSATANLKLYSSQCINLGDNSTTYCIYAGAPVIYNSHFIGWKTISVVPDATVDFYNIVVESGQSSVENVGGDLLLSALGNGYGITFSTSTNVVSKNVIVKNSFSKAFYCYQLTGSPAVLNGAVDSWSFYWSGTCTGKVYRQYEYDLTVLNGEITEFVENANVTLSKNSVVVGSWLTNSSGQVPSQTLTYGYYQQSTGDALQDGAYPFVLTVTHPDWANYTSRFYITEKTKMTISMQNQTVTPASNYTSARFSFNPVNPGGNETVSFDASSSLNSSKIDWYYWDFNDTTTLNSTDPVVTHSFGDLGVYNVSLTISASEVDNVLQAVTVGGESDFMALAVVACIVVAVIVAAVVGFGFKGRND